jgi:hypothetical protein
MSDVTRCKDCGAKIYQQLEKAIGDGTWAVVWTGERGDWTCERTGNEHEPGEPATRLVDVIYHVPVLCRVDLATDTIVKVIEDVESIDPTGTWATPDESSITEHDFERAQEIADGADWPAWDRGL